jgi:hypothetical protein
MISMFASDPPFRLNAQDAGRVHRLMVGDRRPMIALPRGAGGDSDEAP